MKNKLILILALIHFISALLLYFKSDCKAQENNGIEELMDKMKYLDPLQKSQTQKQYQNAVVERVLRSDTIRLEGGERIKLIGLKGPDAPRRPKVELDKNGVPIVPEVKPDDSLETQALNFTIILLEGKHVRLEFDSQRQDENHVLLAYVFLTKDNTFANLEILRQGYADLHIQSPNLKYADQLRESYREARREKRGMQGG